MTVTLAARPAIVTTSNGQRPATAQDFANLVTGALDGAVRHIVLAGKALAAAKEKLPHGEWARMFRDHKDSVQHPIPFGIRTGQMLMAVAAHPVLSEASHGSCLPASWRTLYELTKLPEPTLRLAIERGHVHPGMERRDVATLRKLLPETSPSESGSIPPAWEPAYASERLRRALDAERLRGGDAETLIYILKQAIKCLEAENTVDECTELRA